MRRKKIDRGFAALSLIVTALFVSALFTRCANIGSPSGGPKDTLAPVIMAMTPDNFTTEIDPMTKKIYIEFDEFVKLKDQQKEFYTSPQMKNKPQLTLRGRGVVVTLRDTLQENTTYSLNFGSSIQDNNEGNPLNSLRFVFSTGEKIDSMIMSGYVEDAYTADSLSKTFVLLYPADSITLNKDYDSTIFNATPAVIARAENNGIFMAQNLKPIPYYMYVLQDNNNNMTYEPGTDKVGFLDGTFNPSEMSEFTVWYDSLRQYVVADPQTHFRAFLDKPFRRQLLVDSERPSQQMAKLYFGAAHPTIDSIIFDSIPSEKVSIEYLTAGRDTMSLWFDMDKEMIPDTIRGRVVYFKHDTLNNLSRVSEDLKLAWRYIETKKEQQERERIEREKKKAEEEGEEWTEPEKENPFKVSIASANEINPEQSITFDFDYPVRMIDTAAITLQYLSAQAVELREELSSSNSEAAEAAKAARGNAIAYNLTRDTLNLRRWHLRADWFEEGSEYFLTIPKGALTDIAGFSNDSITKSFKPLKKEDFATIIVNLAEDEENPSTYILDLMKSDGKTIIESKRDVTPGEVIFNYIPAGDVSLRIIQDFNGNGVWDSGDLVKRRQAEQSKFFSESGERKITTKVNWEIEIDVDPATLFAPESQEQLVDRLAREERRRLAELEKKKQGSSGAHNHQH